MMQPPSPHLSEEEIDDALIGAGAIGTQHHLETCPECRLKLDQFQTGIRQFNETLLAYSEARNSRRVTAFQKTGFRFPKPAIGILAAALVLLIASAPRISRLFHSPDHSISVESDYVDSQEQIAQDNELMSNVEAAINPDEASIVDQFQLLDSSSGRKLEAQTK
jgi:hypothetical protein